VRGTPREPRRMTKIAGDEHLIIREDDVLAVLE
jgi:co-chaperonin GroES (HSP10)